MLVEVGLPAAGRSAGCCWGFGVGDGGWVPAADVAGWAVSGCEVWYMRRYGFVD